MASVAIIAAGIGAVGSIVGGIMGKKSAKKAARAAAAEKARITREMNIFEQNRQEVTNPYTSNVAMIEEMREGLSNPFASLGVATSAAEIQMEQTDIALANTLDTLQATGASAGGATALAQAAKQSKKEVAANIEQQEAANEKLRAQGEQALQAKEIQLTQMEMSEEARVQAGDMFAFQQQENRDMATLDRMQSGIDQANVNTANANAANAAATSGMISGITSSVGSLLGSGALKKKLTIDTDYVPDFNFDNASTDGTET
tara:strand:- start:1812 stop:2591 length:780 start_codon:yes stop_codon:yes gene_type:complete